MIDGEEIKRRRERIGLSQGELARKAGLSQQAMSRIENGLSKETTSVARIAAALGCDVKAIDSDFPEVEAVPLSDEAADLLAHVATRMSAHLGFRPTDAQVVRHLLLKSPYSDLAD